MMTLVTPHAIKRHSPNSNHSIPRGYSYKTLLQTISASYFCTTLVLCKKTRNLVKCKSVLYMLHPLKWTGKTGNVLNVISLDLR